MPGEFHWHVRISPGCEHARRISTVRGCFGLGTAHVKVLGEWKKERKKERRKEGRKEGRKERKKERKKKERKKERKKKTKMTKLDLHRFQVRHFSNNLEQSPCYCKMGKRQIADLSVFGRIKFNTRRNVSV